MASYQYNNALLAPFLALPQGDKVQAECTSIFSFFLLLLLCYSLTPADVWVDGDGGLRSKTTVCLFCMSNHIFP